MLLDIDNIRLYQGVITSVDDVSVSIDLLGRMGSMRLPLRLIITNKKLIVGQNITIYMSYVEVE
ncbi:CBO2463/CBO2479 domain-containing protein [Spiroplasma apis]|uniref:S1 motif domain-containing protein n=1 Tax=Spiroplasma apis B31 TaxID=1276258 RepID=V5RIP0_SPIAP|nr:CBO2463/CBO2479 domain-containing protein [Spiroplasma apis]AHB36348.1 hypothetical protein SAPIS_v1c05030 [Spiroplasma apis B31]